MLSKTIRNQFINYLEQSCLYNKYTKNISKSSIGILIRSFHLSSPIQLLTILTFAPKWMANIATLGFFIVILLYILFKGCFLSLLEHRLLLDSFTITDPFLEAFNIEINYNTRHYGTCCIMSIYMGIYCIVYYLRFIHKIDLYKLLGG
jgi:hypothetical protein